MAGRTVSKNDRISVFIFRLEGDGTNLSGFILQENLHTPLRLSQSRVTEPGKLDPFFEKLQRGIQWQVSAFELLDDFFKTFERRLEIGRRRTLWCIRHRNEF